MVEKSLKTSKREAGDNFSRGSCHLAMQNDLGKNKSQYNYYYSTENAKNRETNASALHSLVFHGKMKQDCEKIGLSFFYQAAATLLEQTVEPNNDDAKKK